MWDRARVSDAIAPWVAAVVVAVVRGTRVLALRRAAHKAVGAGRWESVSGKIEPGEDPHAAAIREVREETGLDVVVDPRPIDAYVAEHVERPMLVVVYRAVADERAEATRSAEHDAAEWLSPEEILERGSWPRLTLALARALREPGAG